MMKKAREKRKPLKAVAVILVVMFVVTVPMGAFAAKSVKKGVSRIYGANRYETAFAVADALKEQLGAVFFDAVIVAGGLDFSDALSGSYLAVQKKAPILLTDNKNTEDLSAYIEKNLKQNGTVYILGGTNVISAETEAALKEAGNVKRLGGADRYATNLQILSEAGTDGKELLVCTGLGFADSLSAAAVGSPILLVHPKRGFSAQQKALLKAASAAYIIGGETAIPAKIETELKQYTKTERIGGMNRYQTSVRLAERFYGTASSVSLAYGQNYPDGLCGGVLAYYMNGPLLLVNNGSHKDAAEYRKSRNISTGCVFGGSGLIGDETAKTVFSINSEIGIWEPEDVLNTENAEKAKAFAEELYRENVDIDPMSAKYTWQLAEESRSWIYFTGLVHDGFLMLDEDKYADEVKEFYTKHIKEDGSIKNYAEGTLDAALPAVNMITLLNSGKLSDTERAQYEKAVNYVYRQLENQVSFPEAGNLMQHAQNAKGEPSPGWQQWRVCLDGVYMSQLFMIRLAEAIDNGTVTVTNKDGGAVTEEELWNGVYTRIDFVMNNMRDSETGLLYHGYSVDEKKTNGVFWSRGMGWFSMVLTEAAEKMPDTAKKTVLEQYCRELMTAVMEWQDTDTSLWYNVTNGDESITLNKDGEIIENRPETSGSAMFAYSLLRGYHSGVLQGEEYRIAGLRAFNAMVETRITENGLEDICLKSAVYSSPNMYQVFGYVANDGKGIGPLLMAAKYAY